jgi:hypothetical protein
MHVHPSMMHGLIAFSSVLVLGTIWRLSACHLASRPDGSTANKFGRAMSFQY